MKRKQIEKTQKQVQEPEEDEEESDGSSGAESEYSEGEESDDINVEEEDESTQASRPVASDGTTRRKDDGPPAKKTKTDLYRPPTSEELSQLKETENLFQSSLFRMQITELLAEVLMKEQRKKKVDKFLHLLKDFLTKLPNGKDHELTDQAWLKKKKVCVPIVQNPYEVKGKFFFKPPKSVKIVGSYLLGTCVKPGLHVDVAVELPKEFLQSADYLNHRYLRKRALYLAHLAWKLRGSELVEELKYSYHHGNHLKPILIIKPKSTLCKGVEIRLHTCVEEGAMKLNRFSILKNNVRPNWWHGKPQEAEASSDGSLLPPTPFYNTAVAVDLTMERHLEHLHTVIGDSPGLKEGIALLKVWLHQRELDQGSGCFSGFVMSTYVAHLIAKRKLNKQMSSYQVMRNTLLELASTDWKDAGISLVDNTQVDSQRPLLEDFKKAFEVVLVDPSGYVNVCAAMSSLMIDRVKHEAKLSIGFLENPALDSFEVLFMTPVTFSKTFDIGVVINNLENLERMVEKQDLQHHLVDNGGNYALACQPKLVEILRRALGARIDLISFKQTTQKQWSIGEQPVVASEDDQLTIGLLINPDTAFSLLDRGPEATSPDAKDFREFWGEKSELRRFQDGGIFEAVVWPSKTMAERRTICLQIISHILNRHGDLPWSMIHEFGSQLDPLLSLPQRHDAPAMDYGTGEEQHLHLVVAANELSKILRKLDDLPLLISSIQCTAPAFRYTEVFPPMPAMLKSIGSMVKGGRMVPQSDKPCPPWTPTLKVICSLEGSSKWPENKEAIRRLKAAFHIRLVDSINNHGLKAVLHPEHVDVLKDGYVFRLKLASMAEIGIMRTYKTPNGLVKEHDTKESLELEQEISVLPKFSSTIHGLQTQHGLFSSVARLAKRWLSAQLLLDHIREEVVELIVAQLFLSPAPFVVPRSPMVGLIRFLSLLATHDWKLEPLIVNLNNEISKEDLSEIRTKFTKERSSLPLMYVATPYDKFKSTWTKAQPSVQILQRLVLLAHESLNVIQTQHTQLHADVKLIFRPELDIYDVLIRLKGKAMARQHHAVDVPEGAFVPAYGGKTTDAKKGSSSSKEKELPVVDFDTVQLYLAELKAAYGNVALFFHDRYGGSTIAVLWKLPAFKPQPFKVANVNGLMADQNTGGSEAKMVPNVQAILEDFKTLGEGLVKAVEPKMKNWKI